MEVSTWNFSNLVVFLLISSNVHSSFQGIGHSCWEVGGQPSSRGLWGHRPISLLWSRVTVSRAQVEGPAGQWSRPPSMWRNTPAHWCSWFLLTQVSVWTTCAGDVWTDWAAPGDSSPERRCPRSPQSQLEGWLGNGPFPFTLYVYTVGVLEKPCVLFITKHRL